MTQKHIQMKHSGPNGEVFDVFPKTKAELVVMNNSTLSDTISKINNDINKKANVSHTHSASQVTFTDGLTFQQKLDNGSLKGNKGDKGDIGPRGETGVQGPAGERGKDGLTTSVTVGSTKYTHSNGNITIPAYPTLSSLGAATSSHTHTAASIGARPNTWLPSKSEIESVLTGAVTSHSHSNYLPLTGGTATGQTYFKQGTLIHKANNAGGTAGYLHVAEIKITSGHMNQAIYMAYMQRGHSQVNTLEISFVNNSSNDPNLGYLLKTGQTNAFIHKAAANTWNLYIQKTESYDCIDVIEFKKGSYSSGITVTWKDTNITSLPSGYVAASLKSTYSNITGNAATATKLQTIRSINGATFDGTKDITTVKWGSDRTITIGNSSKTVNGGANVAWSLSDIGALPVSGGSRLVIGTSSSTSYSNAQIEILSPNKGIARLTLHSEGRTTATLATINKDDLELTAERDGVYKIANANGYIEIGSKNTSYVHYQTDRPNHYFNTNVRVNGEIYAGSDYNNKVYHAGNKPTKSDVGLGSVNNWGASSSISANSTSQYATTNMVAQVRAEKANTSHAHNAITSRGNVTAESGVAERPAVSGLSMTQAYNNGYPTAYGNIISLKGTGDGQILVGWSGNDGSHAPVYVRSKRDNTTTANWSDWAQFYTSANPQTTISGNAGTASRLATARTLTIGNSGKTFDGSGDVHWSLSDIGAAASSHWHDYLPTGGGTINGHVTINPGTGSGRTFVFAKEYSGGSGTEPTLCPNTSGGWGTIGISGKPLMKMYSYGFTNASDRSLKYDISKLDNELMYNYIKDMNVYSYRHISKTEEKSNILRQDLQIGCMVDELPIEVVDYDNEGGQGKSVDVYAYATMNIGATKHLIKNIEALEAENEKKDIEIQILKESLQRLEETINGIINEK